MELDFIFCADEPQARARSSGTPGSALLSLARTSLWLGVLSIIKFIFPYFFRFDDMYNFPIPLLQAPSDEAAMATPGETPGAEDDARARI